ncbi:hypothetical protein F4776DRAFT_669850 [Hypoxylon sp. NC0597]|nr:hypothetical protein F4776DRAFT_669850 [Hypoxylon sp. NC0597]
MAEDTSTKPTVWLILWPCTPEARARMGVTVKHLLVCFPVARIKEKVRRAKEVDENKESGGDGDDDDDDVVIRKRLPRTRRLELQAQARAEDDSDKTDSDDEPLYKTFRPKRQHTS